MTYLKCKGPSVAILYENVKNGNKMSNEYEGFDNNPRTKGLFGGQDWNGIRGKRIPIPSNSCVLFNF